MTPKEVIVVMKELVAVDDTIRDKEIYFWSENVRGPFHIFTKLRKPNEDSSEF